MLADHLFADRECRLEDLPGEIVSRADSEAERERESEAERESARESERESRESLLSACFDDDEYNDENLFFYLLRTFCPHRGSFFFFFHYVSAKFHLWPSSGDLLRSRIGMLSLVTVSPVITAFHSCCLSHHVFSK